MALVLGAAALGGIVAWTAKPDGAGGTTSVRFALPIPAALRNDYVVSGSLIALSPDGSHLAYASQDALHLRRMDELDFRRIEGTDGGFGPFFSPDSEWLGFFAGGKLKKLSLANAAVLTLCDAPQGRGGARTERFSLLP